MNYTYTNTFSYNTTTTDLESVGQFAIGGYVGCVDRYVKPVAELY